MNRFIHFTAVLFFVCVNIFAQAPDTVWTKIFGYPGQEYFTSIEKTNDGGFILSGITTSFFNDSSSQWLVRLNSAGDTLWSRVFRADKYDDQGAVQTSDGGFALVGDGDPWLIKTNANGDISWQLSQSSLAEYDIQMRDIEATTDGGIIATGSTEHSGDYSTEVVKTDNNGNVVWRKSYGFGGDGLGIAGLAITETSDGGFAIAGAQRHSTSSGSNNGWLLKISASGDSLWSAAYSGSDDAYFQGMQKTADKGFIMVGDVTAEGDSVRKIYLVKVDSLGVEEWSKRFSANNCDAFNVIQTGDMGYTLIGMADSQTPEDVDMIIIHTAANGDSLWTFALNAWGLDVGFDIVEISTGEYLAVGGTTTDWDTGQFDGWLVRLGVSISVEDDQSGVPIEYTLQQNFPNPFNPSTTIRYSIPHADDVQLSIFNVMGQLVRNLVGEKNIPGTHSAVWDGRNNNGRFVSSGNYFYTLKVGDKVLFSRRMLLLK